MNHENECMLNKNEKTPEIKFFVSSQSINGREKSTKGSIKTDLFSLPRSQILYDGAKVCRETIGKRGVLHQLIITGTVLIATAACGMPIGYSAVLLPQVIDTNDTLAMDVGMGSWVASIHSAATPIGSFASGPIMDRCGRKTALLISILPLIGGWICIALAQSHMILLLGRVIAGMAVGLIFAPAQVYIAEIAEPNLRGALIGAPFFAYSIGILIIYGLGYALHWRDVAWCAIILPVTAFIAIIFAPESPTWLVRHNRTAKAANALQLLRGDDDKAKRELSQLTMRFEREKAFMTASSERFVRILKRKSVLKPLVIINAFNLFQIFSGVYLVVFYAVDIIRDFGGDVVSAGMAAVLTAAVRFVFTFIYCFLLMYTPRRKMSIISGLGSGFSATALAIIFFIFPSESMSGGVRIVCALLLVLYIGCNTGYMLLPGIMVGELLPAKVRGQVAGYIFCLFNVVLFVVAKAYPLIMDDLKTSGLFLVFGISSLIGVVLLYSVLPETKGQSLGAIEDYFMENDWVWAKRKFSMISISRREMS
ncbi:facilitated trehalose transporter Tret1-2 homolog isoform X1 [Lutzomyia longipalpis]|uniref:facilitated trehalose transporter Tret1-2 homolog isoform X1 n=2 Tax=Lutzomyia longipalpis TaxID=7200 RepID=UPI002483AD12|nr:facilitated trehalose transporter Tret1-2 homolog isoform X1 [Lutzomyia longipalpis]